MKKCFDNIDTRILKALQRNGRLQNNELAKEIGLSNSACLRRVNQLEHDGVINPIEIKKSANPGSELVKVFGLLNNASIPRSKGAVICMKPELSAIDRENYIVPVWVI